MTARFYRFCHSSRVLSPFAEEFHCGWFDGGCVVFARALQLWLGGRLAVIVRAELSGEILSQDIAVSLESAQGLLEIVRDDVREVLELGVDVAKAEVGALQLIATVA